MKLLSALLIGILIFTSFQSAFGLVGETNTIYEVLPGDTPSGEYDWVERAVEELGRVDEKGTTSAKLNIERDRLIDDNDSSQTDQQNL